MILVAKLRWVAKVDEKCSYEWYPKAIQFQAGDARGQVLQICWLCFGRGDFYLVFNRYTVGPKFGENMTGGMKIVQKWSPVTAHIVIPTFMRLPCGPSPRISGSDII